MEDKEIRRIASEVKDYFEKKDKDAEAGFSTDVFEFMHGGIYKYTNSEKVQVINKL